MKLHSDVVSHDYPRTIHLHLCDESRGSSALVPPVGRKDTDGLVVARETVDTGLDENEAASEVSFRYPT
jgi:hypothetical protein